MLASRNSRIALYVRMPVSARANEVDSRIVHSWNIGPDSGVKLIPVNIGNHPHQPDNVDVIDATFLNAPFKRNILRTKQCLSSCNPGSISSNSKSSEIVFTNRPQGRLVKNSLSMGRFPYANDVVNHLCPFTESPKVCPLNH